MIKTFNVGDRVRLIEDYGSWSKGARVHGV